MTNEQKALLEILSCALSGCGVQIEESESLDWRQIARESALQAVSLICFDALPSIKSYVPKDIYAIWSKTAYSILANNLRVRASQNNLVKLLSENGIDYVILKGEAAAQYYRDPKLRTLGDVDFLISPADREKVAQLLTAEGFERSGEAHICHEIFKKANAHLEMHFDIPGIPDGNTGELIRESVQNILPLALTVKVKESAFKAPPHTMHGTILLLHTGHHLLGEGVGLRHLCDWYCFVEKTADMDFWQGEFIPLLKQIGLFKFACVLTRICVEYLGLTPPVWLERTERELAAMLLEDILSGGNFGVKDKRREVSGAMISNRGKNGLSENRVTNLLKTMAASVKEQNPKTKNNPLLFATNFTYRCIRYGARVISGKKTGVLAASEQAATRKALYEQLKIFEVTENYGKL